MSNRMSLTEYKKPKRLESPILKDILHFLAMSGVCIAWRANTGAVRIPQVGKKDRFVRFGIAGMSDIQGFMIDGRALFIEVKRPGKKPTALQMAFLDNATRHECVALWADSVDAVIEQFKKKWGYLK